MPKITIDTKEIGGEKYELEIYYSEREGFFIKRGLPTKMKGVIELKHITNEFEARYGNRGNYTDIAQLREAIKETIKEYHAKIKTKRKVIVVDVKIDSETMDAIFTGTSEELRNHPLAGYHSENIGFSLHYRVMYEYLTGESKEYTKKEPDRFNDGKITEHKYSVSKNDLILEWSEEREQFLKNLEHSVNGLCKMILDFFSSDIKEIEAYMDTQQPLLPEPKQ